MRLSSSKRTPLVLILLTVILGSLLATVYLRPSTLPALPAWVPSYPTASSDSVPLHSVIKTYEDLVNAQAASWDESVDGPALHIYGLDESLESYISRLGGFAADYLPEKYHAPIFEVLRRMEHRVSPPIPRTPMRRTIFTTDKDKKRLPAEFGRWKATHPGWDVEVYGNTEMEDVVRQMTQGGKMWAAWEKMPNVIFKADTIRYLMLLLHGGIYTDSDTAPLQHALTWGHDPSDETGTAIDSLRALIAQGYDSSNGDDAHMNNYQFTNAQHPILDSSVSAVLSVENNVLAHGDRWRTDLSDTDPEWRDQFESAVQICQWTMMSKPWHPIFLDTLARIMPRMLELYDQYGDDIEQYPGALNLTGPGPFTQAVYRYLAVMYGFNPRNTPDGNLDSKRIGDIILLPERSTFGGCDWKTTTISPDFVDSGMWVSCHEGQGRWREEEEDRLGDRD